MNERNAKIASTTLGVEDHGIMSFMVMLDYGGSGQGFGGYALDTPVKDANGKFRREGAAAGMDCIMRLLETLGVESWEKLPGTVCRVRGGGWGDGPIEEIGHFMDDRWFNLKAHFAAFAKAPQP